MGWGDEIRLAVVPRDTVHLTATRVTLPDLPGMRSPRLPSLDREARETGLTDASVVVTALPAYPNNRSSSTSRPPHAAYNFVRFMPPPYHKPRAHWGPASHPSQENQETRAKQHGRTTDPRHELGAPDLRDMHPSFSARQYSASSLRYKTAGAISGARMPYDTTIADFAEERRSPHMPRCHRIPLVQAIFTGANPGLGHRTLVLDLEK